MTEAEGWHKACERADLAEGRFLEFALPGLDDGRDPPTGFVFLRNGTLYAYLNRCPHLGIELNWMPGRFMDSDDCFIQCATHGALFIPEDGHCIAGPCQGDALTPLQVTEDSGSVLVRLPG